MSYELRVETLGVRTAKSAFTLVELLVVIGIIAILAGGMLVGMGHVTRKAQRTKAQETVSNAATALTYILQTDGDWPKVLVNNAGDGKGRLDKNVARIFAKKNLMGVVYDKVAAEKNNDYTLRGSDRCGIVTPWAVNVLKRNKQAGESSRVPTGGKVEDHVLYYAIDLDGDGITVANVGSKALRIRASAAVWCAGADGKLDDYGTGATDDVYSWNGRQVEK